MKESDPDKTEILTASLKSAAAIMEHESIPYLLGGGLGTWAHGGPPSSNDIDLMVRPADAERAIQAFADAGLRTERPPEQWLVKAWDGDVLIDLIFQPAGMRITEQVIERAEELNVGGMVVPVMCIDDILTTKLLAMDEHAADFLTLIQIARALREQIDWPSLVERTSSSPFARAFFVLVDGLGIQPLTLPGPGGVEWQIGPGRQGIGP